MKRQVNADHIMTAVGGRARNDSSYGSFSVGESEDCRPIRRNFGLITIGRCCFIGCGKECIHHLLTKARTESGEIE